MSDYGEFKQMLSRCYREASKRKDRYTGRNNALGDSWSETLGCMLGLAVLFEERVTGDSLRAAFHLVQRSLSAVELTARLTAEVESSLEFDSKEFRMHIDTLSIKHLILDEVDRLYYPRYADRHKGFHPRYRDYGPCYYLLDALLSSPQHNIYLWDVRTLKVALEDMQKLLDAALQGAKQVHKGNWERECLRAIKVAEDSPVLVPFPRVQLQQQFEIAAELLYDDDFLFVQGVYR